MVAINKTAAQTARLKITLKHLTPAIWRRVLVPHDIKLPKLHDVIQIAMGWTNSHLHAFETRTKAKIIPKIKVSPKITIYQIPYEEEDSFGMFGVGSEILDERKHRLDDMMPETKSKCVYTYDFGDNWEHDIVLEKLEPVEARLTRAEVIDGKNACPPDDCGSVPGYCDLVEILADPKHPEHANMREWMGLEKDETFDPAFRDIAAANKTLKKLKL
ncbi:hypothetical protein M2103_000614 [Ereboglobus sp. PH5-5]|uniref:plasmid pRiA4b ORF-3 family protein n=1 Tax=Ereboglobus sp. PH5-5 TaxID=2940529 RepID=UPI00240740D4|nr:plasmid pRiA4b ORF-3 family protein [Ereboglobus sp. PH5-5]MDF9832404.1 hypothetical protein [Ereboglobus sp. PH5-5]